MRDLRGYLRRRKVIKLFGGSYGEKVLGYGPIAYWPLNEGSGSTAYCQVNSAQDGAYVGVTLGQPGIGDGNTCPLFDGANDHVNVYTATFRGAFNGAEGSAAIWAKVYNVGVWSDARRHLISLRVDGGNLVYAYLDGVDSLDFEYVAGTTSETGAKVLTDVDWFIAGITWSKTAGVNGEVRYYYNGREAAATDTALGTWVGNLSASKVNIGSYDLTPLYPAHGWLAHGAVWDRPLTPAQMLDLAVV